jgi:hypothetical protein
MNAGETVLSKLVIALVLMALCVTIHASGLTAAFQWIRRGSAASVASFFGTARLLTGIAAWSVLLHLLQIAAWAFFYVFIAMLQQIEQISEWSLAVHEQQEAPGRRSQRALAE